MTLYDFLFTSLPPDKKVDANFSILMSEDLYTRAARFTYLPNIVPWLQLRRLLLAIQIAIPSYCPLWAASVIVFVHHLGYSCHLWNGRKQRMGNAGEPQPIAGVADILTLLFWLCLMQFHRVVFLLLYHCIEKYTETQCTLFFLILSTSVSFLCWHHQYILL